MDQNNRNNLIKYGFILLLFLLLGGSCYYIHNLKDQLAGSHSTIESLSNDIKKHKDKTGAEIAEKELIYSSYAALKAIHASDSSEIGRLQKVIDKNTISATILKNTTSGKGSGKTEIIFVKDTSRMATIPCDTIYPEYKSEIKDKWSVIKSIATKDSTHIDYKFFNEYEITQELKKEGKWPFRHKTPEIKVRNLNPHTETTDIASYAVQVPKTGKRTATIAGVSLLAGILTGFILKK